MKQQDHFDISTIPLWKVAIVVTSEPGYEMERVILVEDHPDWYDYILITGYHCSCYAFDETRWEATFGTAEEIRKIAQGWQDAERIYLDAETKAAPLILRHLKHCV